MPDRLLEGHIDDLPKPARDIARILQGMDIPRGCGFIVNVDLSRRNIQCPENIEDISETYEGNSWMEKK
jgi:hypothetical protein